MGRAEIEAKVAELAAPLLQDLGLSLVEVEYVREGANYLRIYIDRPGGVDLDHCQLASEALAPLLDGQDCLREPYYLEVSSPGLDRPLQREEDLLAAYGSKVDAVFKEPYQGQEAIVGILVGHDGETVALRPLLKGRVAKEPLRLPRSRLQCLRLHLDF